MGSFFSNAALLPIVVFASFGVMGFAIWRVYTARDDGAPVRWGIALIGIGLCAYFVSRLHQNTFSADQSETLRNFFIIISGIGANMLAGGAMVNVGKARVNGAMYRRYPGKKVFSQSLWGKLFVLTVISAPESNKPVDHPSDHKPDGGLPPVEQ